MGSGLKPRVIDKTEDDLQAFGIISQEPVLVEEEQDFEVWPENEHVVQMFLRCSTQWRSGPGGLTGLDYGVLFKLFELYDIKDQRATLEGVQVMETTALKIIGERASVDD